MPVTKRIWKNSVVIVIPTPHEFVSFLNVYGYGDFLNLVDIELQSRYDSVKLHNTHNINDLNDIDGILDKLDYFESVNNTIIVMIYDIIENFCVKFKYNTDLLKDSDILNLAINAEIELTSVQMQIDFLEMVYVLIRTFTNVLTEYCIFDCEKYIHELNDRHIIIEAKKGVTHGS